MNSINRKPVNEFIPPCNDCGGRCCDYIAIELDKPSSKRDYDSIRWYLAHKNVNVFVDHSKTWHVEFRTPCEKMGHDKKCMIYGIRPSICRDHGNEEGSCEYFDTPYTEYFSTTEEFENYLQKKNKKWKFSFHK